MCDKAGVRSNLNVYRCTVHFDNYTVHTPTNSHFIKLDKVLKFVLKITLTCSYMFRSTTVIRETSLSLAKVIFRLRFGKNYVVMLCGGVAACCQYTHHTDMLPVHTSY